MANQHLVLAIEVPAFYTEDIDIDAQRRDCFADSQMSDSDILLNNIGEPGVVRLVTEISGEKDSDVIDVLGCVRSATLEEPSAPNLTDDWLQEQALALQPEQDELIELAVRKLRREDVPLPEIIELLEGEVEELKRRRDREAAHA